MNAANSFRYLDRPVPVGYDSLDAIETILIDSDLLRAHIEAVVKEHPDLTSNGFDKRDDPSCARYRVETSQPRFLEWVARARAWILCRARFSRSFNRKCSSYGFKHRAEAVCGNYVSNGAFIAAALSLGFRIQRLPGSPNCLFAMSTLSPSRPVAPLRVALTCVAEFQAKTS